MIIYFDGPDGAGKTTLKNNTVERLEQLKTIKKININPNGELLLTTRPNRPGRLTKEQLLEKMYEMAIDMTTIYICDRGPISDVIYRAFDEFEPVISLEELWVFWMAHQHVMIVVNCNSNKAEELMLARGDDNPTALQRHKELSYFYKQIMPLFNAVKYDVALQGHKMQDVTNLILARLWQGQIQWIARGGKV